MVSVERIRACREALLKAADHLAFLEAEAELEADLVLAEQHAVAQERPHYSPPPKPPPPKEEPRPIHISITDRPIFPPSWPPPPPAPKKIEPLSEEDHSETAYTHWRELLQRRLDGRLYTKDQCLCLSPTWFILELRRREPGRF